ncbi:MAG: flagellar biosynthesis protein FlgE [Epsilonproteobacteria bacterium]|nr:MAG: flagellar biosynthesis protein FlgE [Campylobacterota bacterium]
MIGALWTGISGLAGQQTALDNESNNIANVNTIGFKSSRISFADQMYQNKIGKGTAILDAEKLYVQGNLKVTGVAFDMALAGDGFFCLSSTGGAGMAETYYSRAGNFRMGENGTLQDSAGNAVQGWAMTKLSDADIVSTDSNIQRFTKDFVKLGSSQIVRNANTVESITAKMTDYNASAVADSKDIFSGGGYKTKSSKTSDIEGLISSYTKSLIDYKNSPTGSSITPSKYSNVIDYSNAINNNIINGDSDSLLVTVNGSEFSTTWDTDLKTTLKNLANELSSKIKGVNAWVTDDPTGATGYPRTPGDEGGYIRIESLIPGQTLTISQIAAKTEAGTKTPGVLTDLTVKVESGSGYAAVVAQREALKLAVTGKQQDVYLPVDDFGISTGDEEFSYQMTIVDPLTKANISVPSVALGALAITLTAYDNTVATSATNVPYIDQIVNQINTHDNGDATLGAGDLPFYIKANNINGALVIETLDSNYELEISSDMKQTVDSAGAALATVVDIPRNSSHSGRTGANAEFLEITSIIQQTGSRGAIQLKLDALGISNSPFGDFSVDSAGLITMKQDGGTFAIGQVAIALFNNNRGLLPIGDNLLRANDVSGTPIFNLNNNKAAAVKGNTLELSTADLSSSLVNLMVFQRAFEANAKSITTADSILNTLINLKR